MGGSEAGFERGRAALNIAAMLGPAASAGAGGQCIIRRRWNLNAAAARAARAARSEATLHPLDEGGCVRLAKCKLLTVLK